MVQSVIKYETKEADLPTQWAQSRQDFREFVKTQLKAGQDFGVIPGTDKPTLLKPGAEKLLDRYGLAICFDAPEAVENWEKGLFAYRVKARVVHRATGVMLAEQIAACNSLEDKYKYRKDWWNGKGTPPDIENYKRTKSGKLYKQVLNPEPWSLQNTILKMAQKRAAVGATIYAVAGSEFFTQDVEDWPEYADIVEAEVKLVESSPKNGNGNSRDPLHWSHDTKTRAAFWAKARERGLSNDDVHRLAGVPHLAEFKGTVGELWTAIDAAIAKEVAK